MKKFEQAAAVPGCSKWQQLIARQDELYERADDIRSPFARDYTRILHSLAYRRMKHKTQVFFNAAGNDHICTRIEHVSHVESVSGTVASYLGLNEELTRAIAMAHDLGHAPFGHEGEKILRKLSEFEIGETFWHEKNGVYFVDNIELLEDNEKDLRNLDLTYAVRDGIISHCGEMNQNCIFPREELFDLDEFRKAGQYQAATWEGCVVKIADKIAYLGRDIEDAMRMGYLSREQQEILQSMAGVYNENAINTTVIMHNMIIDLCENSSPEDGLRLSEVMSRQLNDIKAFNYKYIYGNERLLPFRKYASLVLQEIYGELVKSYDGEDTLESMIASDFRGKDFVREFADFLAMRCDPSCKGSENFADVKRCKNRKIYGKLDDERIYRKACIDFIAGMTDPFAINCFNELLSC